MHGVLIIVLVCLDELYAWSPDNRTIMFDSAHEICKWSHYVTMVLG